MNQAYFRDQVLQQYKGANTVDLGYASNIKEYKMTKNQLREAIRQLIRKELNEATMWEPEVDDPEIDTDTETEENDDYTFNPEEPGSLPDVAPKATKKEQDAIAKLIAMYKAEKANLNEAGKTWAQGYEEGYNDGFKDSTQGKSNKFKK
jgi:hypothetical protein